MGKTSTSTEKHTLLFPHRRIEKHEKDTFLPPAWPAHEAPVPGWGPGVHVTPKYFRVFPVLDSQMVNADRILQTLRGATGLFNSSSIIACSNAMCCLFGRTLGSC